MLIFILVLLFRVVAVMKFLLINTEEYQHVLSLLVSPDT